MGTTKGSRTLTGEGMYPSSHGFIAAGYSGLWQVQVSRTGYVKHNIERKQNVIKLIT